MHVTGYVDDLVLAASFSNNSQLFSAEPVSPCAFCVRSPELQKQLLALSKEGAKQIDALERQQKHEKMCQSLKDFSLDETKKLEELSQMLKDVSIDTIVPFDVAAPFLEQAVSSNRCQENVNSEEIH